MFYGTTCSMFGPTHVNAQIYDITYLHLLNHNLQE